jgi:hypothetical protein
VRLSLDLCTLDEVQPLNSVRLSSNLCALDEVELQSVRLSLDMQICTGYTGVQEVLLREMSTCDLQATILVQVVI